MPIRVIKAENGQALQDIADLLVKSHKIILITGAGISTSCGIPDFRSKNGLYNGNAIPGHGATQPSTKSLMLLKREACRIDNDEPSTSDSSASHIRPHTSFRELKGRDLFQVRVWADRDSASSFYQFIAFLRKEIRDDVRDTSATHKFIRTLRDGGRLMRCYTQNIDGLEARDGLVTDMGCGRGSRRRFMKKIYETHLPKQTKNTEFDAGVEIVHLHGNLETLRCTHCQEQTEWTDEATAFYVQGVAPDCKNCIESSERRKSKGKRALSIGELRPNIVLYGEPNPADHYLGPLVLFDVASGPEVLIIMGTSLKSHGLKRLIRDFAKAVHSFKGKGRVIFINRERPAESLWKGVVDDYISMDCDAWVQDLQTRQQELWLSASRRLSEKSWSTPLQC